MSTARYNLRAPNGEPLLLWMFYVHVRQADGRIVRSPVMSMGETEEKASARLKLVIPLQLGRGESFIKVEGFADESGIVDGSNRPIHAPQLTLELAHAELGMVHDSPFTRSDARYWLRDRSRG